MASKPPLFKPLPAVQPAPDTVSVQVVGAPVRMFRQASLAAGLLAAGVTAVRRSPVGGEARAPYCMMGVCFECLVEVDGKPSRQACLTVVRDGMVIRRQHGASALELSEEGARHGL